MATKTILLNGVIEEDFFIFESETSAKLINRQLNQAVNDEDTDQVILAINSPGGSVMEGIAIFNEIQRLNAEGNKPINTRIDGIAYSMGAVIAMAGKKTTAYKNTSLMLHNASGFFEGNAQDMRSALKQLDVVDSGLAENIASKTGKTVDQVKADYMNYTDNFYSAREAVDEGFIDSLIDEDSSAAEGLQGLSVAEAFAYFKENSGGDKGSFGPQAQKPAPKNSKGFMDWVHNLIDTKLKGQGEGPKPPKPPKKEEPMKILAKMTALAAVLGVKPEEDKPVDVEATDANLQALEDRLGELTALKEQRQQEQTALTAALKEAGLDKSLTGQAAIEALQNHAKELGKQPPQYPGGGNLQDPPAGPDPKNEFRTEYDDLADKMLTD